VSSKDVQFTQYATDEASDKLAEFARDIGMGYQMDQEQQRDYAEEAANRALLHEEEYTPSSVAEAAAMCGVEGLREVEDEQPYEPAPLRATYAPNGEFGIGPGDESIVLWNDDDEVSFAFHPSKWPSLLQLIDAEYQKYLELSPNNPRAETPYKDKVSLTEPDAAENNWTPGWPPQ